MTSTYRDAIGQLAAGTILTASGLVLAFPLLLVISWLYAI